ncbi:MAG: GntR family transcriptional regulator [Aggregatilineales bacterium]
MLNPIDTPNLSDAVYDILRRLIISGDFEPGQRLHLTELETSLNVSRTPLKTALKRLELEGMVTIHARRGTFIAETSASKLEENYKIRSSFELYVALCLFKYLSPEDYAFFDAIRQQMNDLVEACEGNWQGIVHPYVDLDRQFHERLVAVGGPPRMLDMFKQLNVHVQMVSIIPHYGTRDFQAMHFEHEQIFASIMDRSPERLNATLLNHLESARFRALHYAQESA